MIIEKSKKYYRMKYVYEDGSVGYQGFSKSWRPQGDFYTLPGIMYHVRRQGDSSKAFVEICQFDIDVPMTTEEFRDRGYEHGKPEEGVFYRARWYGVSKWSEGYEYSPHIFRYQNKSQKYGTEGYFYTLKGLKRIIPKVTHHSKQFMIERCTLNILDTVKSKDFQILAKGLKTDADSDNK